MSNEPIATRDRTAAFKPAEKVPPAIPCSDCRNVLRTSYFSLDERPLCPRCAQQYRDKIDRASGPQAMLRATLYGSGAAIAGMIGLSILLLAVGAFRILGSIGIAYLVAKAIGKATGDYGGRRYQILAVALTYVAIGGGLIVPVIRAGQKLSAAHAPPKSTSRTGPAGEQAEIRDEMNDPANPMNASAEEEDPAVVAARAQELARRDSVERLSAERARIRAGSMDAVFSDRLSGNVIAVLIGAVSLLVILPIASSFAIGLYPGVFGIFALGYGMRRAWQMTALVTDHHLSGPFKVGTGPIAPTIGT
jgi:hypothetical protein